MHGKKISYQVIGGGLAGLTAACALAREGAEVDLFEHRHELGGRAITTDEDGCRLNLGPHALYKSGLTIATLRGWGIELAGGAPDLSKNSFLVKQGERHALPTGLGSVAMTGLLSVGEKLEFASAYGKLAGDAPEKAAGLSVSGWLDQQTKSANVRQILEAFVRLSTYSNQPDQLSMEATQRQLRLSAGGVLYLDGGWQQMIDKLAAAARAAGVRIRMGETVDRVRPGTILATSPAEAEVLAGVKLSPRQPLRMATLDLALDGLPEGAAHFALGIDQPTYFSVHTQWAKLAPAGVAVVHAAKYLAEVDSATREELEQWCDVLMPGWRGRVRHARFLPDLAVVHAMPGVTPRPAVDALGMEGVALAGDWVGPDGMLADAAVASGLAAAKHVMQAKAAA